MHKRGSRLGLSPFLHDQSGKRLRGKFRQSLFQPELFPLELTSLGSRVAVKGVELFCLRWRAACGFSGENIADF